MGRTGEVDAVRVFACLFVLGAHLLFWWVLTLASRGPTAAASAGRDDALQVIWIEPAAQPPPLPPDTMQRPTASSTVPRRTLRAPAVSDTPIPQPGASPRDVPLSAVFIDQGRRLAVPAPDPDAFRPDPLAHRAAKLPGVQADTFHMRTPLSTQRVLRAIGGLVAGPGYTTDPCPRVASNIERLSQDGDSALLQEELRRKRQLCD